MSFSLFTLLSTQIIISIFIVAIFFCIKNNAFICKYGLYFILAPLLACSLRFIFPFETSYSIVLRSPTILTTIYTAYSSTVLGYEVSTIVHLVICLGILASLFLLIKNFYQLYQLSVNSVNMTSHQQIKAILTKITAKYDYDRDIKILFNDKISTPFVFGYIKPTIYIPDIKYNENELRYIIEHELVHFLHKDLWVKLIIQLICAIYWWNPFIYLLRAIVSHSLELKCDSYICRDLSIGEKKAYLHTIMHILEASTNNANTLLATSSFGNKAPSSSLIQRFELVFDYESKLNCYKKLPIIFSLILFLVTYSIIIQPEYTPSNNDYLETSGDVFVITPDTSYILKKSDGYYLYSVNNELYKLTSKELDDLLSINIKIKEEKEVLQ